MPLRLRVVDTLAVFSGVPMVIAIVALGMISFRWVDRLGLGLIWQNEFAFCAYWIVVLTLARFAVCYTGIHMLKVSFRVSGMMTRLEAESFPLNAGKGGTDAWPETWQKPCRPESLDPREQMDAIEPPMQSQLNG